MGTARARPDTVPNRLREALERGAALARMPAGWPGPAAASRGPPDPRETVIRCFLMYAEPLRSQSLGEGLEPGVGRGRSSVRVSQP